MSTGFFRQKSKALVGMAQALVDAPRGRGAGRHGRADARCPASAARPPTSCWVTRSACPDCPSIATCCAWPTASGWCTATIPKKWKQALAAYYPPERWTKASDLLILHGRRVCRPTPLCDRCNARADCDYYRSLQRAFAERQAVVHSLAHLPRRPARQRSAVTRDRFQDARRRKPSTRYPPLRGARSRTWRSSSRIAPYAAVARGNGNGAQDETLLGLYQGTPLPERSGRTATPARPHHAVPAVDRRGLRGRRGRDRVAIGETLIHELGHYFGLSEEEIMEIEERYWRGEPDDAGRVSP